MDVYFKHYRVPEGYLNDGFMDFLGARAKPPQSIMFRYSPHHGEFIDPAFHRISFLKKSHKPLVRGGMTKCIIVDEDGLEWTGVSICSLLDNFCYRIGREIAYGRAISKMEDEDVDF